MFPVLLSRPGAFTKKPKPHSSRSLLGDTCSFHTLYPRLKASTEVLKLLAPGDLRQESIQPERQLIIVKGSPAGILPACFETERMHPRYHIQQVTPPFELRLGILLHQKYIISSRLLFIPAVPSRFAGKGLTYQHSHETRDALEING